jgi:hypothetical protein
VLGGVKFPKKPNLTKLYPNNKNNNNKNNKKVKSEPLELYELAGKNLLELCTDIDDLPTKLVILFKKMDQNCNCQI